MIKRIVVFISLIAVNLAFATSPAKFMKYPAIHKDKIVFTYENDLWMVPLSGGVATRLTNAPGTETQARFSPDGKTIAFTATYDGGNNVYTIPSAGGEPIRISYNPGGAQAMGWTKDGKKIVARSMFEVYVTRDPNLYFFDVSGGAIERFPIDRGTMCSFSADGKEMLYVRKGNEEYNWKKYKGGQYCDIWNYNFETNKFTAVTDYVGKNAYPMWIGDKMYFVSDRDNTVANLYVMNLKTKEVTQLTKYSDVDVITPETDGENIVFMHNGSVNVFNVNTGLVKEIDVVCNSDRWELRNRTINPKDYIHQADVSNDGKTVTLEARGDVYTVATEDGSSKNLTSTAGSREMYPRLSPDGKTVAFFSDKTGDYQLYTRKVDGTEWNQITTSLDRFVYHLEWSPDGKKILFGNKDFALFYVDVDSKKMVKIDESHQMKNDEFYWEVSDYSWSPDSKWIAYSFVQYNRNNKIFIYSLDKNEKYAVTNDFFDNLNPSFDANGKYLYFLQSNNFEVTMDFYEDNHVISKPQRVMVVQLQNGSTPPFAEPALQAGKEAVANVIDVDGIEKRVFALPTEPGNFFHLKAGKNKVLWSSVSEFTEDEYEEIFKPKGETKWNLHIFDMNDEKETVLNDKIKSFSLSLNREQLVSFKENDVYTTSVDQAYKSKQTGAKLNVANLTYTVVAKEEWTQIFNDAWRWYRDFFYAPNFHGKDWNALGDKYRAYIPNISSREDLNWVMLQLVGELSVSHTYITGGDMGPKTSTPNPYYTGWLGADFVADKNAGMYKIEKLYGPTEVNPTLSAPLSRPDIDAKEGYYLIAIDGKELTLKDDYNKMLMMTPGRKVSVTLNSKPAKEGSKTYTVEPIRNSQQLRYFYWLTNNVRKVSELSGGKLGYMHINAMGSGGVAEFDKFWRAFRYRDGIVVDVRRNSGGWTEYFMIDKLERKMTAKNTLRGMEPFRYPGSVANGNYVALSNEYNGSDGEAFIEDFKANNLGPVVGVPSWGGLVGILNTQSTIDNGSVEQSNNSFYNAEGKWLVENHGADPTVVLDNDPQSVMAGKDPQLEKAIEMLMKHAKDHPFTFPAVPAYGTR